MTPRTRIGSTFFLGVIAPVISVACGRGEASPPPAPRHAEPPTPVPANEPTVERCLGVRDTGIWADLDDQVQVELPSTRSADVAATIDRQRSLLVLWIDGFPRKSYPLDGATSLTVGPHVLALRPGDRTELARLVTADRIEDRVAKRDADKDGIPDPLDILIGAKKTVANADHYTEGYVTIEYPRGDVPRDMGVCTDVIIRAVRNAGVDLQSALHEDIKRSPASYPMVKKPNPHIDQRRVKTLLPYFKRHWEKHTAEIDDAIDPLRPGDVVFMDTFPSRSGPDHIGIVSDRVNASGQPLIINNWTTGTVTAEMDLLSFVPITHRFRLPP